MVIELSVQNPLTSRADHVRLSVRVITPIFACFYAGYYVTFTREKSRRKLPHQKLDIGVLFP